MITEPIINSITTILEMFRSGGIITYAIAIIGIYGLALSIEKMYYLRKISRISTPEIIGIVNDSMEKGGALEALRAIGQYQNPISKIISEALKIGYRNKAEVEDAMERVFIVEMSNMTRGLGTLKTIIEITPLLGLIGTVIGIWHTFKVLGVNADPTSMAQGIYIALITTIAGLTVAILLLPFYSYLTSKIEAEIDKIELIKKMTNWNYAVMKIKVEGNLEAVMEALRESEGIVNVKLINEPEANMQVAFKPSMLEKSINNIILEKCNKSADIIESRLKQ
ncbi:MAG TPA: MotA/TolQ/ExbB proton channel family protein [Methanothermobacter sp.]|uniref:Biopolymer transporter ExbB n=1 Tax=Methanothermobacter tenebrarum TaxID=680118 RepID=A0ABN6PE80_9EURY|nr:MotA/TolQ/ExbB proton channel family protein [Methanothermobacter tenebrarum]BDH79023.1 biopolymer transporter ExbB [Methanothermobacter tenebrarum]HHW16920.1 MotA/TolQ/ExbB proton channel family protein [Methanothermobacter sp.]